MHVINPPSAELDLDELTRLELHIARRADELSRERSSLDRERDCWLDAEREVWQARLASECPQFAC